MKVRVTGTWRTLAGDWATGIVRFEPVVDYLISKSTDEIILPMPFDAYLDELGSIDLYLPATDDPAREPVGWHYRVTELIEGVLDRRDPYDLELPGSVTEIDLSDEGGQ